MLNQEDEYLEYSTNSIITIKKCKYIVIKGFVVIYKHRIIYLDGAMLQKVT